MTKGMTRVRQSKYRHVFGKEAQLRECFQQVRIGSALPDSYVLQANPTFFSFPASYNGGFIVHPVDKPGAIDDDAPVLWIEDNKLNELKWSPHDDHLCATASQEGLVHVWRIPEGGLTQSTEQFERELAGHAKRALNAEFHPHAANVVLSWDAGKEVRLWDVEQGSTQLTLPSSHKGLLTNCSWDGEGSRLATACKDKKLRVFDPRANAMAAEVADHDGAKGSKVIWAGSEDLIITFGHSRTSERAIHVWDPRNMDARLARVSIDQVSSTMTPFYDDDARVVYLTGRGDGNIRIYEVSREEEPYVHQLTEHKAKDAAAGMALLPRRIYNVKDCEVARFLKLTNKQVIPVTFTVPRQNTDFFQDDLYPETLSGEPSMTAGEWFGGANTPAKRVSLEPADM